MNKVIVTGRWTRDIDLKFTAGNGTAIASGTLAVERRFKKEGQPKADFPNIVIWQKQAEAVANYCGKKGDLIAITGRLQTRTYDKTDGSKAYVTEIVAEEVEFLNSKKKEETPGSSQKASSGFSADTYDEDLTPMDDGDIPF